MVNALGNVLMEEFLVKQDVDPILAQATVTKFLYEMYPVWIINL